LSTVVISSCIVSASVLLPNNRSLTMVSLSLCSGMPEVSKERGPFRLRVSTSSVSKRPSPSVSIHRPIE
jgi:hypothetical protein